MMLHASEISAVTASNLFMIMRIMIILLLLGLSRSQTGMTYDMMMIDRIMPGCATSSPCLSSERGVTV